MKILQVLPRSVRRNSEWIANITHLPVRSIAALRYMFSDPEAGQESYFITPSPPVLEKREIELPKESPSRHISFTFAAISLSALVARADGTVSKEEYLAFRDSFPLTGGMCGKLRQLFLLACQSSASPTSHVQQIKYLFPNKIELFISLVDRLFRIATADKPLTREEERLLAKISHALGLNPGEYSAIYERYSRPLQPHVVLGVERRSPRTIIKQRYYALMNRYHPDRYASVEVSPEVSMLLTLKTSEISQAYRTLTKKAA